MFSPTKDFTKSCFVKNCRDIVYIHVDETANTLQPDIYVCKLHFKELLKQLECNKENHRILRKINETILIPHIQDNFQFDYIRYERYIIWRKDLIIKILQSIKS